MSNSRPSRIVALALAFVVLPGWPSRAQAHSYFSCIASASYQLSQCRQIVIESPNVGFTYGDCLETFYFLRDDPHGCRQFDQ
jgi:hypothetical protein